MSEEKPHIPLHRERLGLPDNEAAKKLSDQRRKQLIDDFRAVFGTAAGRRVLRHFMGICGYKRQKIGGNPSLGLDVLQGTFYNATREQVFLEFIELIPQPVLRDCEFGVLDDLLE